MIKISKQEKDQILNLSVEFISLHGEIMEVEKSIKKLEIKSSDLLENLENCRKKEKEQILKLQSKYGAGFLDPVTMEWKKEEIEHGIEK
jgi:hypothetical protein